MAISRPIGRLARPVCTLLVRADRLPTCKRSVSAFGDIHMLCPGATVSCNLPSLPIQGKSERFPRAGLLKREIKQRRCSVPGNRHTQCRLRTKGWRPGQMLSRGDRPMNGPIIGCCPSPFLLKRNDGDRSDERERCPPLREDDGWTGRLCGRHWRSARMMVQCQTQPEGRKGRGSRSLIDNEPDPLFFIVAGSVFVVHTACLCARRGV